MNIKELAEQATLYANDIQDADAYADWYEVRDTKFAELVAAAEREACIDIVARHGGSVEIEAAIRARSK